MTSKLCGGARARRAPAIALTCGAGPVARQKALGASLQRHLSKPVELDPLTASAARLTFPPKVILVVDDDADIRDTVAELLRGEGYVARTAVDGRDALRTLAVMDGPPCLVLLDMMMPVMDGWEFLQHVAKDSRPLRVVALTASGVAKPEGVEQIIRKPTSFEAIVDLVRAFCGSPT
jgi:CheY-like chemotaxis protein